MIAVRQCAHAKNLHEAVAGTLAPWPGGSLPGSKWMDPLRVDGADASINFIGSAFHKDPWLAAAGAIREYLNMRATP